MERPAAIEIDDLTVRFDNRNILERFSMRIEPGEKVHLQGRSGSGKSTLLRSVLGFVAPEEGAIRIEGGCAPAKRRSTTHCGKVGYV